MLGEINKDFYCLDGSYAGGHMCGGIEGNCNACTTKHGKWPTPKQFKEEYGEDYPDDGAVYVYTLLYHWMPSTYADAKRWKYSMVCACTPWGKPPDEWRPE